MDVVSSVRSCLATWNKGGEVECRNVLFAPHCNPSNPECLHILTTAYHTLLSSVLTSWSPEHALSVQAFADFVRGVLNGLPSSSSSPSTTPDTAALFGEHLIDIIWTIDAQLDEILVDARTHISSVGDQEQASLSPAVVAQLSKVKKAKQAAEGDKERLQALVKKLLEYGVLNITSCRERLDSTILMNVGLIAEKVAFDKKEIRVRTGLFYKQNKHNLLREQSEGYSKLTTEITSSLGPPHSPQTGLPAESPTVIENRARPVWEKVISLIGYFDLDPNRALDVILDILSTHLATHYSFFLALLSCSPWASHRRETSSSESESMAIDNSTSYSGKTFDEILASKEPSAPSGADNDNKDGSRVLAQVLGFKFAYYRSAENSEPTPRNLYLMTALLIREGFITLEDIYPHLSVPDEEMVNEKKEYEANLMAKTKGTKMNALTMAVGLGGTSHSTHDTAGPTETKEVTAKESSQKVGLLKGLLALGAIRPALSIMTKFPWLVNVHHEIADLTLQILRHSILPLYESTFASDTKDPSLSQPRPRYGHSGPAQPPPRKHALTLIAPAPVSTSSTDFTFFYPHWSDRIPTISSLEDIEGVIEPILAFLGPQLSRDPIVIAKLARLGALDLQRSGADGKSENLIRVASEVPSHAIWYRLLRLYFLPSMSLLRSNAVCTVEIWNVLRLFEPPCRYQLYGAWRQAYSAHPELRVRQLQADKEAKDLLNRIAVQTVDSLSGAMAKLAHSNPCILFKRTVAQVLAYGNMGSVIVDALKCITNMGLDVLAFHILDVMADANRDRVKEDGVNTSDWLQSLASFAGALIARYNVEIAPFLKYVVRQLAKGETTEIVVLQELVTKMVGIIPVGASQLNDKQVNALAGGPYLRIQSLARATRGSDLPPDSTLGRSAPRLGNALAETKLILPLIVQVAVQREDCVFQKQGALKTLASLFDDTHAVLEQFIECLSTKEVLGPQGMESLLDGLEDLALKHGIPLPICMEIIRPGLHHKISVKALEKDKEEKLERERRESEAKEQQLKANLKAKRDPNSAASATPPAAGASASPAPTTKPASTEEPASEAGKVSAEATEGQESAAMEVDTAPATIVAPAAPDSPWLPELEVLFERMKKIVPASVLDVLSAPFFLTFWQLSLYDLAPPTTAYEAEVERLNEEIRALHEKARTSDKKNTREDRADAVKSRQKAYRCTLIRDKLLEEDKDQCSGFVLTNKRLVKEKPFWFTHQPKPSTLAQMFIEYCIQPRCFLSPGDAEFCAHFIRKLHSMGTPGFPTLMVYDKLLADQVRVVAFTCTPHEATNYGRFLLRILETLHKWHVDEQAFMNENRTAKGLNLPGFQRVFVRRVPSNDPIMSWNDFKQIMRKWHRKICKGLIDCLQTGEYMHVNNALNILQVILPAFPLADVVPGMGHDLHVVADHLVRVEKARRPNLHTLAQSYDGQLMNREHLWAGPKSALKPNGIAMAATTSSQGSPAPERPRSTQPPTGPSSQSNNAAEDRRREIPTNPRADASQQPPASAPSGPRAGIVSTPAKPQPTSSQSQSQSQSTRMAIDSIPRPEVVKRVRTEGRAADAATPVRPAADVPSKPQSYTGPSNSNSNQSAPQDVRPIPVMITGAQRDSRNDAPASQQQQQAPSHQQGNDSSRYPRNGPPPHAQQQQPYGLPNNPNRDSADSRRMHDSGRGGRPEDHHRDQVMAPPAIPSQTPSAHELRETARQSIQSNRGAPGVDRDSRDSRDSRDRDRDRDRERDRDQRSDRERESRDREHDREREQRDRDRERDGRDRERDRGRERDRDGRDKLDVGRHPRTEQLAIPSQQPSNGGGSGAPSPRVRSPSPTNASTRDHSLESRGSGGKMRSDRMMEAASALEERSRESGGGLSRDAGGAGAVSAGRRDSLTHTRERTTRDRASERDREERERTRDRHGDRERDRGERERERDRDPRDRESHRDRDPRDRDRDRSRRDERDRKSGTTGGSGGPSALDGLPNRPDPRRSTQGSGGDDSLGKRRRGADDDSDRASKRSSRKDREERGSGRRVGGDKDGNGQERPRESDRRRKDRDVESGDRKNTDSRASSMEKASDKRSGDPPRESQRSDSQRGGGSGPTTSDNATTPTTSNDPQRSKYLSQVPPSGPRSYREKSNQGQAPPPPKSGAGLGGGPGASLRSRISDSREGGAMNTSNSNAPGSSGPVPPSGSSDSISFGRPTGVGLARDPVPGSRHGDDDRDGSRKRTASEREKEVEGGGPPGGEPSQPAGKRPRINRNRLPSTAASSSQNHGVAKRLLPLNDHVGDRGQRRHD